MNFQLTEPLIDHSPNRVSSFTYPQKPFVSYHFDYEIDNYIPNIADKISSSPSFPDSLVEKYHKCHQVSCCQKNIIKSFFSKNKIRFHRSTFDLDLVYITKRVIAMGYPSTMCESLILNSLNDIKRFLSQEHGTNFKIYNLCLEPDRIYNKKIFDGAEVGLFPFYWRQSCPVKLMLEFCVDLCLFLLSNDSHIGAIHSKQGKGRTGIMICGYLIFTGIAINSSQAFDFYGERRSENSEGITIASQKRYVQHFETYLSCNFTRPYYKLIPKIIEKYLTPPDGNLLSHVYYGKGYYDYRNVFKVKKIKVGPFKEKTFINCQILNFRSQSKFNTGNKYEFLNFKNIFKEEHEVNTGRNLYYFIIDISDDLFIDSDVNVVIYSKSINFNVWINLFYITLENFIYLIKTHFKSKGNIPNGMNCVRNGRRMMSQRRSSLMTKGSVKVTKSFEMDDLSTLTTQNDQIKKKSDNQIVQKQKKEDKKLFIRSYDANFFWEQKITLDETGIKNFMKNNTKYVGDHIHSYDLNNIYEYMNLQNSNLFDSKRKKFKIKMNTQGVDNFKEKNAMIESFCIEITYYLYK